MNPADDIRVTKRTTSVSGVFKLRNSAALDLDHGSAINHDALTLSESVHQLFVSVHIALLSAAFHAVGPSLDIDII